MKIVIIFPKDSEALFNRKSKRTFGGASIQMYLIAKELSNYKDIQTFSFIPNYKTINFNEKDKFNLIKTYNENDSFYSKILKFNKKLEEIKPDVVIQHGLTLFSCLLAKYCKLKGIKFIYMFAHDIEVKGRYQSNSKKCILFNILLSNSYKIITQNKYQQNELLKSYNKESHIIYNGFPIKKPSKNKKDIILWVARCDKWKRPELFIELAKRNKNHKFLMICPESKDKDYYKNIINKSKYIKNLRFIPFVQFNKIDSYFKKAKLFINTSKFEGYPQTFIQATMNSTPILSLNVDPDGFITKYNCGYFCNGDLKLLNKRINELIRNKGLLYIKLSKNAYNYAKKNHNIKLNVKKLLNFIKHVK